MGYTVLGLKDRILEIHPEIAGYGIIPSLTRDEEKGVYVLKLTKLRHELSTYIDTSDADTCIDGRKCIHLGLHVAQFIANFREEE